MSTDIDKNLLQAIEGAKARIGERDQAIRKGDAADERRADEAIPRHLDHAANACPSHAPQAKRGFQNASRAYSNAGSREKRDNIIVRIYESILVKAGIYLILIGAASLGIAALAEPAVMMASNGAEIHGYTISNGDGTSHFDWDSNNNGLLDSQFTVNDLTGQVSGEGSMDLVDALKDFGHAIMDALF